MAVAYTCTCLCLFFGTLLALRILSPDFARATPRKLSTKRGYQMCYLDVETYKRVRAELLAAAKVPSPSQKLWSMEVIHRDTLLSSTLLSSATVEAKVSFSEALAQRLERGTARVAAIGKKLKVAQAGGITVAWEPALDRKGVESMSQEEFSSPITSGIKQGSGEYFTRFGIGTPAKEAFFVMDTGSDLSWTQCEPCGMCYKQSDPLFNPTQSTSYSPVSCSASLCSLLLLRGCQSDQCLYEVDYGDGSFTVGDFAQETLTFGSNAVQQVAFGCGHDNEGLFVGASGVLGLGAGRLSLPTQIKQPFSYCLADRFAGGSSELLFGASSGAAFTPLLQNAGLPTFYYVELQGISVGGSLLNIPPSDFSLQSSGSGGVIVDSGTSVTRLVAPAYTALRDAFKAGTTNLPSAGSFSILDTCYTLGTMSSVDVPTVDLHFAGGTTLALPAANYLVPVDTSGTYCLAFAGTGSDFSIIGNVQQQGYRVSFDTAAGKVGFAASQC